MASEKKGKNKKGDDSKRMASDEMRYCCTAQTELAQLVVSMPDSDIDGCMLDTYLQVTESEGESLRQKLDERDQMGMTALHFAVCVKKLAAVRILLMRGASVDIRDSLGFTPLFMATGRYEDHKIASYLLSVGKASVNVRTETGVTPLHGAALMGNIDSIKLLLKHGADPHCMNDDFTSPLDVAKDDTTKLELYKAAKRKDRAVEKEDEACASCGKHSAELGSLKRCGQCRVTLYCSKECQSKHWKNGHRVTCEGFVIARCNQGEGVGFHTTINTQHGNTGKFYTRNVNDLPQQMEFLRGKRFIVKVQIPLAGFGRGPGMIMVYSEDRSAQGFIYPDEPGYHKISQMVMTHGVSGIKAFFWAELTNQHDGSFKVYHGKCAPKQQW